MKSKPISSRRAALFAVIVPLVLLVAVLFWHGFSEPANRDAVPAAGASVPVETNLARVAKLNESLRDWSGRFEGRKADSAGRAELVAEGVKLAEERKALMLDLIRRDPETAIRHAVSLQEWAALPEEVQSLVERPFSEVANFQSLPVCLPPGQARVNGFSAGADHRSELVMADGTTLQAYTFGRRSDLMSKRGLPVQGIALDGEAAVQETVFQKLDEVDVPTARAKYASGQIDPKRSFASGKPLGDAPVLALAGGKIYEFVDATELESLDLELGKLDQLPGPDVGSSALEVAAYSKDGTTGFALAAAKGNGIFTSSTWTETKKKVYLIRVDFSNNTGSQYTAAEISTMVNGAVSNQIQAMSYGKTFIEATVSENVYRLPQTSTYYVNSPSATSLNDEILRDGRNAFRNTKSGGDAAINIGPVSNTGSGDSGGLGNYDIVGVVFRGIGMKGSNITYSGLASVGGSSFWIQGDQFDSVYVHEFGHAYGLGHASFWQTSDGSVVGTGATVEYGDDFDIMGGGDLTQGHFHPQAKALLNWITPSQWTDATASGSGTHRVYRIDDPATVGTKRGVRVTKVATPGSEQYYWIGYRPAYTGNNHLTKGAYINWQRAGNNRCWLIDTVPATSGVITDAPIDLGTTYADTAANVFVTPLAVGGAGSEQYLDVRVNIGPFPGNTAPVAGSIAGPATVAARTVAVFSLSSTDANGDTLSYHWDFGDGVVNDSTSTQAHVFPIGGSYTVNVTVTDMKGGTSTATKSVTVTDPLQTWTQRTSGTTNDLFAVAANSTTVVACGGNAGTMLTSTDGQIWTAVSIPSSINIYFKGITWTGNKFIAVGQDYDFNISKWVGVVYTSPTGATWTKRRQLTVGSTELRGVAASGSGLGSVALASGKNGTVLRSTDDGITWTDVSQAATGLSSTDDATGLAYGGAGLFLVSSYKGGNGNGITISSPDGLAWTNRNAGMALDNPSNNDVRKIAWLNDRFVGAGWYSGIRTSTDGGLTFTSNRAVSEFQTGFAYGNGVYFTCGEDLDNGSVDVDVISQDGVTWTSFAAPTTTNRNAAVFFKNTFITVGDAGTIWQSGNTSPPAGFAGWQALNFPTGGLGALSTADADNDGIFNLVEYALSRNPNATGGNDGAPGAGYAVRASNRTWLHVDVPEPAMTDVTYVVQGNTALTGSWTTLATKAGTGSWTWVGGGTARLNIGAASGGRVPVEVGTPDSVSSSARYFLRMSVQIP